jgi:hypothetical protein
MCEDYWYLLEDHSAVLDHRDILRGLDEPLLAPQGGDHLLPCNTLKEYQFFFVVVVFGSTPAPLPILASVGEHVPAIQVV